MNHKLVKQEVLITALNEYKDFVCIIHNFLQDTYFNTKEKRFEFAEGLRENRLKKLTKLINELESEDINNLTKH